MSVRNFLLSIGFATITSCVAVGLILWRVDPFTAGIFGHLLFYLSLFFALFGLTALGGFAVRLIAFKEVVPFRHIGASLRQGFLLSGLFSCTLLLLGNNLLRWWNGILLFAGLVLFEGLFQLTKFKKH